MSTSVHDTLEPELLRQLHDAVLGVVAFINRPDRDDLLIREARLDLDRALFPLLVLSERYGPLSVGDLAARIGRDHSTISRQVAKLAELGLIERKPHASDARQRELHATAAGRAMVRQIEEARNRLTRRALAGWSVREVADLTRSLERFAKALAGF